MPGRIHDNSNNQINEAVEMMTLILIDYLEHINRADKSYK